MPAATVGHGTVDKRNIEDTKGSTKMYNRNFTPRTGFTLASLFALLWVLFCLAMSVGLIYAGVHFICKYW